MPVTARTLKSAASFLIRASTLALQW